MAAKNQKDASRVAVDPTLLEWAEYWYPISWKGVLGGGVITAVGACATIAFLLLQWRTTTIREEQSDWRTSVLETDTLKAKAELGIAQADIAKANAQIAEATARTKEAELKLEQLRERMKPREIHGERFLKLLEGKPKAPVEVVFVRDDPECFQLAMQIRDWLKQAKWEIDDAVAIAAPDTPRLGKYTSSMGVGGQPSGVTIVQRATSQADFERERHDPFNANAPIDTPAKALSLALADSLGAISGSMSFDTGTLGVLRVVVGPKFQQ